MTRKVIVNKILSLIKNGNKYSNEGLYLIDGPKTISFNLNKVLDSRLEITEIKNQVMDALSKLNIQYKEVYIENYDNEDYVAIDLINEIEED